MAKLYELTEMYQNVWNLIEDEEIDLETLEMALSNIESEIELKAESIAKLVKSIDSDVNGLKEEENRLSKKRKTLENKQKNLKRYMESQLIGLGLTKVKTPLFTVAMQKNPASVNILDEDLIPELFKKSVTTISITKKEILDAIKNGDLVPGAEMFQTESLRIR